MWDVHRAAVAAVVGLALVAGPAVVSADDAPFTRAELDEALRLRVSARHTVTAVASGATVVVTVDGRSRSVTLGRERGAAAARVVALVAAALAVESSGGRDGGARGGAAGNAGRDGSAGGDAGDEAVIGGEVRVQAAGRVARAGRWGVGVSFDQPSGARGVAGAGAVVAFERGRGTVRWTATLGFDRRGVDIMSFDAGQVSMTSISARAGIAIAVDGSGRTAVTASALAAPFITDGGVGHEGVLTGGGVGARFAVPLPSATADLLIQAGVDVMTTRIAYRWDGETLLDTGRTRPYLVVGLSWEGGP